MQPARGYSIPLNIRIPAKGDNRYVIENVESLKNNNRK
jgi:hypothetical protein